MTASRYALYFAPDKNSALWKFGSRWLGRDVVTGERFPREPMGNFSAETLEAFTSIPRHYGFHGSLKPPFHLAEGRTEDELIGALQVFAAARKVFNMPPLKLSVVGGFLTLALSRPCPDMDALAVDCVRDFDGFRRASSAQDLARRRARNLSPRQEALLNQWGYPYVMDEFRFHMSLTNVLEGPYLTGLMAELSPEVEALSQSPVAVDSLGLFMQETVDHPFNLLAAVPFYVP